MTMLKYTYKRFWKEYTSELNKKDLEHLKSYLEKKEMVEVKIINT